MKFSIVVLPGSDCGHDCYRAVKNVLGADIKYIWHQAENVSGFNCNILPGGFSYGDCLRTGAIARFSNVMNAVMEFAQKCGLLVGIIISAAAVFCVAEENFIENKSEEIILICKAPVHTRSRNFIEYKLQEAEDWYIRSINLMKRNDWKNAEATIQKIMELYPSYKTDNQSGAFAVDEKEGDIIFTSMVPLKYSLVLTKFKQGKFADASTLLADAKDPASIYLYARCLDSEGLYLKAIIAYRALLEQKSEIPDEIVEFRIGLDFLKSNNGFSAETLFRGFLDKYPKSVLEPYARYHLGSSCFINKKYADAEKEFNALLDRNMSAEMNIRCHFMLGECKFYLTDYPHAEEQYLAVMSADQKENLWIAQAFYRKTWCAYKLHHVDDFINLSSKFKMRFAKHELMRPLYYLMGYSLAEEKQYEKAIKIFRQVVTQEPKDELWYASLKQITACYFAIGDTASIITVCQHLLENASTEKTPWKPGILLYLGEAYYLQGFYEKAKTNYSAILSEYPLDNESIEATRGLGWCFYKENEDEKAKNLFSKLAYPVDKSKVSPDIQTEALWQIGNILSNQGNYAEAAGVYDALVTKYPESAFVIKALYNRADVLYRSEYYSLAIKTWEQLIEKSPPEDAVAEKAASRIASTYFLMQDFAKAGDAYQKWLDKFPRSTSREDIYLGLAQSWYNAKDYLNAIKVYKEFITAYPTSMRKKDAENGIQMSEYLNAIEKNSPELLADFARNNPGSKLAPDALLRIGQIHFEKKDQVAAIEALQNVFTRYPQSEAAITAYYMLARIYQLKEDYAMESQIEKTFVTNFPASEQIPEVMFNLGLALAKQEKYEEAIDVFKKMSNLSNQKEFGAPALYNMALCYKKLKYWDKTAQAYEELINKYPHFKDIDTAISDLASILSEQGNHAEAVQLYSRLSKNSSGESRLEFLYKLAEERLKADNKKQAEETLLKIFESGAGSNPWRIAGLIKLGEYYENEKQWNKAINIYKEIADVSGQETVGQAAKAKLEILFKLKDMPQ